MKLKNYRVKYYKEDLEEVILKSINWSEVCRHYGLLATGGSPGHLRSRADKFEIDYSHFTGKARKPKGGHAKTRISAIDYINSSGKISSHKLRLKLIEEGIKRKECEICNLSQWMNNPIPLELDHIDGNHNNNNFINLRILCKNCYAQTDTYGSKKRICGSLV